MRAIASAGVLRRHQSSAADIVVAAVGVVSVVIALVGGPRLELIGVRLSLRDWIRPAMLFGVLVCLRLFVAARSAAPSARSWAVVAGTARIGLWLIVLLMASLWLAYLDTACGGLDSHGYVST